MKFSSKPSPQTKPRKGVTLIELTVVISIILLLISILITTSKFYTVAADRSTCIININGIQKAIRAHENFNRLQVGDPFTLDLIIGSGNKAFTSAPICPESGGDYILVAEAIPPLGNAATICQDFDGSSGAIDSSHDHTPPETPLW